MRRNSRAPPAPRKIGAVAALTGLNIETIRYYERVGVLPKPPRSHAGQRVYDETHAARLVFVRRARELGFSLEDVRALLHLAGKGVACCDQTKAIALRHLSNVRGKIASLRRLERTLGQMSEACTPGEQAFCPIVEALSASNDGRLP